MPSEEKPSADLQYILEHVSLDVGVCRNLSPWYHSVPDVAIDGEIRPIQVKKSFSPSGHVSLCFC